MDFIERLFGFSPDGGSGSLEFGLLLAGAVLAIRTVYRFVKRRRRAKSPTKPRVLAVLVFTRRAAGTPPEMPRGGRRSRSLSTSTSRTIRFCSR